MILEKDDSVCFYTCFLFMEYRGSPSIQIELPVISSRGESADSAMYNVEDISNVRRKNDTYADLA